VADEPEVRKGLPLLAFPDSAALEAWLEAQPPDHPGIWLKLAKAASGRPSVTKSEAVDAGLAYGWIDGLLHPYDERYFLVRFTPRRPKSKWSLVNVERAEALIAAGRMRPGGLRQIESAKVDGRWEAAYPPHSRITVPADLAAALDATPAAKAFFETLKGANRYAILYRLHDVVGPAKRAQAIAKWVAMLARGETAY
jgi:uncharacterized protein YdeI (YjbR/CyaY-like superfamily)